MRGRRLCHVQRERSRRLDGLPLLPRGCGAASSRKPASELTPSGAAFCFVLFFVLVGGEIVIKDGVGLLNKIKTVLFCFVKLAEFILVQLFPIIA